MTTVQKRIHKSPWNVSHGNINVALRVFSQRLNNQSHFVSGCAYTIWILPDRTALPPGMNRLLQAYRAENCLVVFEYDLVLYGNEAADDLWQLQGGPENATEQFILETSTKEEASYEGTLSCMADVFKQLLLNAVDEQMTTAIQRVIAWIGDQLTIERLRGLWKYRHEDHNSFDRLDYMIPIFGWFHLVMAFANSIHKQYLGNSAAIGSLRQAFDVLKRKGLITQSTKGPFWHHLDEALHHISEAHFRASWLDVGNVENLADLKSKSPQELRDLAATLIQKHASREAVNAVEAMSPQDRDEVALKTSFPPYSSDFPVAEIRRLHREWPEDLRNYIREFCWLMSRDGGIESWLPFDIGQEQNICDIKVLLPISFLCFLTASQVNYRSMGPGATMDYMGKVSPAIPALRKVQRHMEK
ncbi:hypothetical protein DFH08DRAFT_935182 [Mycena albidolilacea]|uniref:DUF6589 domain-containing protein n=1 Tax=Mycena albidolilacea TaxID=1033008 RepID=A0AAD7EV22_9AGAR|nr:hypothetical protein DFH08DRAFT_935182 [Mycena albidolilacea]